MPLLLARMRLWVSFIAIYPRLHPFLSLRNMDSGWTLSSATGLWRCGFPYISYWATMYGVWSNQRFGSDNKAIVSNVSPL